MFDLIDHPVPVEAGAYDQAIDEAARLLQAESNLMSVYQIGGVSVPGISDLDMVAVFGDDAVSDGRVVEVLRSAYPYLFIHNLYGAPRAHFEQAQRFSFFHNYRLLWGEDVRSDGGRLVSADEVLLKRQIALEYLVKLYVNMVVQRAYGAVKVRGFLLHAKAVAYDLEFLGVEGGDLYDLTYRVIDWRNSWFEATPSARAFVETFERFFEALVYFLEGTLEHQPFYFPGAVPYRMAKNLWLQPGTHLGYRREGLKLPPLLSALGNRYFKLSNRLNRFDFTVPATAELPPILAERSRLVERMGQHNRGHLPHFDVLTSSL